MSLFFVLNCKTIPRQALQIRKQHLIISNQLCSPFLSIEALENIGITQIETTHRIDRPKKQNELLRISNATSLMAIKHWSRLRRICKSESFAHGNIFHFKDTKCLLFLLFQTDSIIELRIYFHIRLFSTPIISRIYMTFLQIFNINIPIFYSFICNLGYIYTFADTYAYIRQTCFHHCTTPNKKEFSANLPNGSSKRQSMRSEWPVGFFVPIISAPLISSSESRLTHCPEPSYNENQTLVTRNRNATLFYLWNNWQD